MSKKFPLKIFIHKFVCGLNGILEERSEVKGKKVDMTMVVVVAAAVVAVAAVVVVHFSGMNYKRHIKMQDGRGVIVKLAKTSTIHDSSTKQDRFFNPIQFSIQIQLFFTTQFEAQNTILVT
jgi:hypothetical protein